MNELFTEYKKQPITCPFCKSKLDKQLSEKQDVNTKKFICECTGKCGTWEEVYVLKLVDNFKPTRRGKSYIKKIKTIQNEEEEDKHASTFGGTL